MKKYNLCDLSNLTFDRELNSSTAQFFMTVFCEYLISYCGYGVNGNDFYPLIKKRFCTNEVSGPEFLGKLLKVSEMEEISKLFPIFNANGKFNNQDLYDFMHSSSIELTDEENIYIFRGKEYRWKRLFVNVFEKDGQKIACTYSCRLDKGVWLKCGSITKISDATIIDFETIKPKGESKFADTIFKTISDEQFFDSSESPEDLRCLDEEQRKAVSVPIDKNSLILAGAGSGKTRCLVSRLAYLNLVKGVPLNKIVLLTFTNNVAIEMKKRARDLLNPVYAQYYPGEEPQIDARTIDSFFVRILIRFYKEIGFKFDNQPTMRFSTSAYDIEIEKRKAEVLRQIIYDNGLEGIFSYYLDEPNDENLRKVRMLVKKVETSIVGLPVNTSGITNLVSLYLSWQLNNNEVLGFESATYLIKLALEDPTNNLKSKIEELYSCILIDEFQDISKLQNDTFSVFYDGKINFTFCGDDDQTIYGFRGSDNAIIKGISEQPNVVTIPLSTNYRSDPVIVEAANAVLNKILGRTKNKKMKTALPTENKIHVATYNENYSEIVAEIDRIIEAGEKPEDILILTRSDKVLDRNSGNMVSITDGIYNALTSSGVPANKPEPQFVIGPDFEVFVNIINVIINNKLVESISTLRDTLGIDNPTISDFYLKNLILGKEEPIAEIPATMLLDSLSKTIRYSSDQTMADLIERVAMHLGETPESKEMFNALRASAIDDDMPWKVAPGRFNEFIKHFKSIFKDTSSRSKKKNAEGVRINTIHKAKGLQANTVFIVGLESGKVPNTEQIDREFKRSKSELLSIRQSRAKYMDLKKEMTQSFIDGAVSECDVAQIDEIEKKKLTELKEIFDDDFKEALLGLDTYAIDQLIYSYNQSITALDNRYTKALRKIDSEIQVLQEELDGLLNEKQICLNNLVDIGREVEERIAVLKSKINDWIEKQQKTDFRARSFTRLTTQLRQLFKICNLASGYLADIYREDELAQLEDELTIRREKQINEERRVFYVALTRAGKALYLMHLEGTNPSDFISIIPKDLLTNEKLLTKSQQIDLGTQIKQINKEVKEENADSIDKKDLMINIKDEGINNYVSSFIEGFYKSHPVCEFLTGESKEYLDLGLRFDCISKMTGLPSELPISTCFERSALRILEDKIGKNAIPFKTNDAKLIEEIVKFVRNGLNKCKTNAPGYKYLSGLFDAHSKENPMQYLKGISIMNYFVLCNNLGIFGETQCKWNNPCKDGKKESNEKLLISCVDLSNCRNCIIHDDPSSWPKNILIDIFKYYLAIVNVMFL